MADYTIDDRSAATEVDAADRLIIQPDGDTDGDYDKATADQVAGYTRAIYTISYAASVSVDREDGENQKITLTGNWAPASIDNVAEGQEVYVQITQDGTGSRTIDFGTLVLWEGGTEPTWSTDPSAVDLFAVRKIDGSLYAQAIIGAATA